MAVELKREFGLRDLTIFYVVTSLSLRWIATAAASGEFAITMWVLALFGFFIPFAGCVLELSSRYPQEGGLYVWTREAFGDFFGFMVAWIYWMSNLPYFPALLYFAAGSLLFADPRAQHLAASHSYYMIFTTGTLVLITALNVIGVNTGKWINNLGAIGTCIPILTLISVAAISYSRFGSATHFTMAGLVPHANLKNLIFLSTIFFAFAGCESGSSMGDEIRDGRRTIPRALLAAGVLITLSYIVGTAALLTALPQGKISGLSGFMSAIQALSQKTDLGWVVTPVALLVVVSCVGGTGAFLSSTARLPFVAGIDHYLPPIFGRIHPRWRTPYIAVSCYGLAAILFGLLSQAGATVSGAYDLLVAMGVITAFIPFLFIFASVIRLQREPLPPGAFRLPGGKRVAILLASLGLISTSATIVLSLFPAEDDKHPLVSMLKIIVMTVGLLAAGAVVYRQGSRARSRAALEHFS